MQASRAGQAPQQQQMSRADTRLWHGTLDAKAWIGTEGATLRPLILEPNVLEPDIVPPFADELDRSPTLRAAFQDLLANPDAAGFRGEAGQPRIIALWLSLDAKFSGSSL